MTSHRKKLERELKKLSTTYLSPGRAAALQRRAKKLRDNPPQSQPYPPPLTDSDRAEIDRLKAKAEELRAEINCLEGVLERVDGARERLECRGLERRVAQWRDARSSPDWALYMADVVERQWASMEAGFERQREEREREARDPLVVLGLPSNATSQQITQRFRALARRNHPDGEGSEVTVEAFQDAMWAMNKLREKGRVT